MYPETIRLQGAYDDKKLIPLVTPTNHPELVGIGQNQPEFINRKERRERRAGRLQVIGNGRCAKRDAGLEKRIPYFCHDITRLCTIPSKNNTMPNTIDSRFFTITLDFSCFSI